MNLEVYKQLPCTRADGSCPICRHKIRSTKNVCVELHDANHFAFATAECRVLYCTTCAIPFANGQLVTEVRKKHKGLYFDLFTVNKKCSAAYIESKMKCGKTRSLGNYTIHSKDEKHNIVISSKNAAHEIVAVSPGLQIWKSPQTLISSGAKLNVCPKCSNRLYRDHTFIPINKTHKATVPGLFCLRCECLYVENKNAVDKILRDNPYAKGFTLDGESLWNAAQILKKQRLDEIKRQKFRERIAKLRAIESSVVMICVSFGGKSEEEFVIVNQAKAHNPESRILHYASTEAREMLSATFAEERGRKGTYGGKDFRTVARPIYPDSRYNGISELILPTALNVERGGGYYSSVMNRNYEIVDVLLYSPFSKRYELIKATCNKSEDYCFVDIGLYRRFVKEHGNPQLFLDFSNGRSSLNSWDDLSVESVLKGYGYSVSQGDAFSATYRQDLLAEIIDLEILTVPKIVSLLDFFIRTHPLDKDVYACYKWAEDKRFVENYRANPSRFLIAKNDKELSKSKSLN